jgi:hypothetical protein
MLSMRNSSILTDTASSASFLDIYLEFDDSGQLSTKIYDKRDDFNFKIINFPNMCSNIPANSDSYEYKNKSARRGAQFVPIGMPTTCWNSVPPKETNMLSMRNSSILITCSSSQTWVMFWHNTWTRPHYYINGI